MMANDDLLTLDEAALLLRTPTRTLRRWIRNGRIPAYKPGRRLLLLRRDLLEFVRGQKREPVAEDGLAR